MPPVLDIAPSDRTKIVRLYRDKGLKLSEISPRVHRTSRTIKQVLQDAGIEVRPQGRPPISEEEWDRRKKIAATCTNWADYVARLGLPKGYNPAMLDRRHGVRLRCFFCSRLSETTRRLPPGPGSKPVCALHVLGMKES